MSIRRSFKVLVLMLAVLGGSLAQAAPFPALAQGGAITYESQPDEVALYLSDIAFVRDRVTLPAAQDTRVYLPPGTYPGTLILTEDGARVHSYRLTPLAEAAPLSPAGAVIPAGTAYVLTWDPVTATGQTGTREIVLEYLLHGASWTPLYDMRLVGDEGVELALYAEIRNNAVTLDEAAVYLVAGRVDLSQQVDHVTAITMNQYVVGYEQQPVALPAPTVGTLDMQHVYPLESLTAQPGDIVYANLVDAALDARRLYVWNAATQQETDVIYKVTNSADVPFAEGVVRVYEDNLFLGSDFIETTPVGSEGSVTVGTLPDVRVSRRASAQYMSTGRGYYLHDVTLEVSNYGQAALDLTILDDWDEDAWGFRFSEEPVFQPDNLLRWEVNIPAGETLTITYSFRTES